MADNKEKSTYSDGIEIPPEKYWDTMDNEFVLEYKNGRFTYTKDFYMALYKKIHEGKMTYVQAYESLGFDVSVLGPDRANAAGKRAVQMAEEGRLNAVDPSSYDGSVPREKMGEMSHEEEFAWLKARNIYLEEAWNLKKKFLSGYLESSSSSNRRKN